MNHSVVRNIVDQLTKCSESDEFLFEWDAYEHGPPLLRTTTINVRVTEGVGGFDIMQASRIFQTLFFANLRTGPNGTLRLAGILPEQQGLAEVNFHLPQDQREMTASLN